MTSSDQPPEGAPAPAAASDEPEVAALSREVEALRRNQERLRALLGDSAQILWSSEGREQELESPNTWESFTGQSPERGVVPGLLAAVHPEDQDRVREVTQRAKEARTPYEVRYRLRRADGQYVWMLGRGVPLLDARGGVREWVGASTDIHAQHEAEERARFLAHMGELLAASLDYDTTLEALARLMVPTLADWCIVDVLHPNGHFARAQVVAEPSADPALVVEVRGMSPVPREEPIYPPAVALAQGRASLVPEVTDEVMRQVAQNVQHLSAMRRLGIRSLLTVPLRAHGRVLGALTLLRTRTERRYAAADQTFVQEVAHRAALSVDNARLYREAQEAIRLRDEFLSIASHELKTPLTPLSLKLQAIDRAAELHPDSPLTPLVRSHVAAGLRQVRRLAALMVDLLDVSRIVSGSFRIRRERVDLMAVVREVVALFVPRALQQGSALRVSAEGTLFGQWDRTRLEQVVANLLDNALKYGAGTPVDVTVTAGADAARLSVRDQGIGIAPEHVDRIFDRYARAVSERNYGGLGLGLYITRTIVESEGGRVSVESEPGQGSTFVVDLPVRPA
jgi:PAS domain S-box-containing protein